MSRKVSIAIFALCVGILCAAAPVPPNAPPQSKQMPAMEGVTNWDTWIYDLKDRTKFTIEGHPQWTASGEVRKDGSVLVLWEMCSDGRRGPGVYKVKAKSLEGAWGWDDKVIVEDDGSLSGQTMYDVIARGE